MKFVVLVGALCAAASLVFAGGASARTYDQAYLKARACLISHGASKVRHYGDGGQGTVRRRFFTWWYHPDYSPHVEGVSVALLQNSPRWVRAIVSGCLQPSVGLGPAGWLHFAQD